MLERIKFHWLEDHSSKNKYMHKSWHDGKMKQLKCLEGKNPCCISLVGVRWSLNHLQLSLQGRVGSHFWPDIFGLHSLKWNKYSNLIKVFYGITMPKYNQQFLPKIGKQPIQSMLWVENGWHLILFFWLNIVMSQFDQTVKDLNRDQGDQSSRPSFWLGSQLDDLESVLPSPD